MFLINYSCFLFLLLDYSNGQVIKDTNKAPINKRFFDLNGILSQLFPGFNQGIQGGSGGNPGGIGRPSNSQFYPGGSSVGTSKPNTPTPPFGNGYGQGSGNWPIIDDASWYPYQGQNPGNNFGIGMPTQNPSYNQYPSQALGGSYPQIQYPGQWNIGKFPHGKPNRYPGFQANPGSQQNQYPGFFGNPGQGSQENQYPGFLGTPSNIEQGSQQGIPDNPGNDGNPGQGVPSNQNGQNISTGSGQDSDGTLDSLVPPQPDQDYPQSGVFENSNNNGRPGRGQQSNGVDSGNAILGRPVVVPTEKTPDESIVFPKSTENPSQKQCVQDCQTTSEYSPVCGTDNVTYFNPGRFVCARNCGINVFVRKQGRCDDYV